VAPFATKLPDDWGFYLVAPITTAESPKISAFRQWLIAATQAKSSVAGLHDGGAR
jgi:LysR family glycine cleavage system transcriptional activator